MVLQYALDKFMDFSTSPLPSEVMITLKEKAENSFKLRLLLHAYNIMEKEVRLMVLKRKKKKSIRITTVFHRVGRIFRNMTQPTKYRTDTGYFF